MRDPLLLLPGYSLRRATNAMGAELNSRLATLELRRPGAAILMLVDANPGITASALGRALDIKRANMVPLLRRLEEDALIEREAIDGKSRGLTLTAAGQQRLAAARAIIDTFEAELMARIPAEHRDHLIPALEALWR
ncbi:MAG: MarR family transcriptional regulator [Sphingomonadales bacterium 32-68-7]|nr:MAG: MarR family transcriptional regulator [Sphingomonadales bacterium 12-68-11]OYX08077.1 MAG: MarR family transcriptional regulator [Sphingomonadales bacterium 32-68-7]